MLAALSITTQMLEKPLTLRLGHYGWRISRISLKRSPFKTYLSANETKWYKLGKTDWNAQNDLDATP